MKIDTSVLDSHIEGVNCSFTDLYYHFNSKATKENSNARCVLYDLAELEKTEAGRQAASFMRRNEYEIISADLGLNDLLKFGVEKIASLAESKGTLEELLERKQQEQEEKNDDFKTSSDSAVEHQESTTDFSGPVTLFTDAKEKRKAQSLTHTGPEEEKFTKKTMVGT